MATYETYKVGTKSPVEPHGACPERPGLWCPKRGRKCGICGWNADVEERRIKAVRQVCEFGGRVALKSRTDKFFAQRTKRLANSKTGEAVNNAE